MKLIALSSEGALLTIHSRLPEPSFPKFQVEGESMKQAKIH